jgi:hypothetical protein
MSAISYTYRPSAIFGKIPEKAENRKTITFLPRNLLEQKVNLCADQASASLRQRNHLATSGFFVCLFVEPIRSAKPNGEPKVRLCAGE